MMAFLSPSSLLLLLQACFAAVSLRRQVGGLRFQLMRVMF